MTQPEKINNPSRRRLAKGMIAGPAVLATITSKHALGTTYACTVSGHDSANISRGIPEDCVDGFNDCDAWVRHFQYDTATNAKVAIPPEFGVTYEVKQMNSKGKVTKSTVTTATYRQAFLDLSTDRAMNTATQSVKSTYKWDRSLTLAGLTVYLNAGTSYHIRDKSRALEIFKVATSGGLLSGTKWDKTDCAKFLRMLAGLDPYAPMAD